MSLRIIIGMLVNSIAMAQAAQPVEPLGSDYSVAAGDFRWTDSTHSTDLDRDYMLELKLVLDDRQQTPEHHYVAASEYSSLMGISQWAEVRYLCQTYPPRADDFMYQVSCMRSKELPIPETARQMEDIAALAWKKFPNRVIASDLVMFAAGLLNNNGYLAESIRLYKKSFEQLPARAKSDILFSKLTMAHALANPLLQSESQRQALAYYDEARKEYQDMPDDAYARSQVRWIAYEKAIVHLFLFHEYSNAIHELDLAEGYQRLAADIKVFKAYAHAKNKQEKAARDVLRNIDWSPVTNEKRLNFLKCYVELTQKILGDDASVRNCVELNKPQLDVLLDLTSTVVEYPLKPADENAIWRNFYHFFDKQLKPDIQRSLSAVTATAEVQQNKAESRLKDLQIKNLILFRKFTYALVGIAVILVAAVLMALRFWHKSRLHAQTMNAEKNRLQNILNNIEEGIIKILPGLTLVPEDSQHLKWLLDWSDLSALSISKLLDIFELPPDQCEMLRACLNAALGEDALAWDLNSSNLPADIRIAERDIVCFWQPIIEQGQVQAVLLVMHDRTAVKMLEQDSQKAREAADSLLNYAREIMSGHPKTAQQFIQELPQTLSRIQSQLAPLGDRTLALRLAHTIKGNARSLRLSHLQDKIHRLESVILENSAADLNHILDELSQQISIYQNASQQLITGAGSDLTSIVDAVASCRPALLDMLKKADIPFRGVRILEEVQLDTEEIRALQDVILHGLTNAADHGFVLPKRRGQNVEAALFEIEVSEQDNDRQFLIRDNGCGIHYASLQKLATSKGWTPTGDQNWSDFLFSDGVSTSEELSATSGRGVGLAAIRSVAAQLSGRVRLVDNDKGKGTLLQLTWPAPKLRDSISTGPEAWPPAV